MNAPGARRIPWMSLVFIAALFVPALGSRFYTFLANDVAIWALFATSLNLLVGYTGLVSFGHAAYFGIGAYTTGLLMKKLGASFLLAFPAAGLVAGVSALVFGFFCVRLTRIYFAMLTLAFAQIVWAICFKWNEVTGGEQGMPEIPYPSFDGIERLAALVPFVSGFRTSDYYYLTSVVLVAACLWILRRIVGSPFGRMLTTIRENAERAEFIGVHV
ncbi:MAG: ABC transporter permease, partial [Candidatus Rokuibacteriota bacterium]